MLNKLKAVYLMLFMTMTSVAAQEINTVKVGLLPHTYDSLSMPPELVEMFQKETNELFKDNQRFVVTNEASLEHKKLSYQRNEIIETGQLQGAQYLISVHYYRLYHKASKGNRKLSGLSSMEGPSEIMADLFSSNIQFSMKIYDVSTGELRADQIIFGSAVDVDLINPNTRSQPDIDHDELLKRGFDVANKKAFEDAKEQLKRSLDKIFSFSVSVKSIEEPTQLGSCILHINGGKNMGISKDVNYGVYVLEDYNTGESTIKRKRNLAYAYDVKNLTETSAELKVLTGKKNIIKAYNEGQTLYCTPGNGGLNLNPKQIITVAISPFSLREDLPKGDINWLEELFTNSVVAHGRLKVVERKNLQVISSERELQKTDEFLDSEVIEQGKSLGADYMLFGEAYEFKTWYHVQKKELEPKTGYYTNLKLGIKLVNTSTGKVEADKIISIQQHDGVTSQAFSTPNKSQASALYILKEKVNRLMLQTFPLELEIVEITEASRKGEAKRLLINGGTAYGLHMRVTTATVRALAGTPFEVFEVNKEEVDGQMMERTVQIGEIVLKDVENDLISECKVRSGGDLIQKNFESGKRMICRIKGAVILN